MNKNTKIALTFLLSCLFILLLVMTIGCGLTGFLWVVGIYSLIGIILGGMWFATALEARQKELARQQSVQRR